MSLLNTILSQVCVNLLKPGFKWLLPIVMKQIAETPGAACVEKAVVATGCDESYMCMAWNMREIVNVATECYSPSDIVGFSPQASPHIIINMS